MTEKYKNKYRVKSHRMPNWDYGWNAAYFVTICTQNREHYFGEIINHEMQLSEIGEIASRHLTEIPQRFNYAILDEFIVMPNHIHAIIIIDKNIDDGGGDGRGGDGGGDGRGGDGGRDAINRVSTATQPQPETNKKRGGITGNKNPMLNDNLSRIMNWYTGRVTFESHKIHADFGWQSRFYDHIIRNDKSYQKIKNYIINNPKKWNDDKFKNKE